MDEFHIIRWKMKFKPFRQLNSMSSFELELELELELIEALWINYKTQK